MKNLNRSGYMTPGALKKLLCLWLLPFFLFAPQKAEAAVSLNVFFAGQDSIGGQKKPFPDYLFPGTPYKKAASFGPANKNIVSGEAGISFGRVSFPDPEGQVKRNFRFAGVTKINFHLFENVLLRTTLFKQFQTNDLPPWTSDYFYVLERYNWRPNTFSYGYENYAPNKYNASMEEIKEKFLQGKFYVVYLHNLPSKFINAIRLDKTTNWSMRYFMKYSINYQDENGNNLGDGLFTGKLLFGFGTRYIIGKNFFTDASFVYFPERSKLVPWDADFTYDFGYYDWRSFTLGVSYGSWVANRYPWNEKQDKYTGFLDGDFRITFSYAW